MEAHLSVFNTPSLEESPEIFNLLNKILTFSMSFKSTLYSLYFQGLCRIHTEKYFSVGQFIHKSTLFLYTYVTKRLRVRFKSQFKENQVGQCQNR
jgi:hypothetical protein